MYEIHVNNDKDLEKYNNEILNKPAIIFFYMEMCGHCKVMKPEWEKFIKMIEKIEKDVIVARVRSDYLSQVEGFKDVMGFPTIISSVNGKKIKELNPEDRTSEKLMEFFNNFVDSLDNKNIVQSGGRRRRYRKTKRSNKRMSRRNKSRKNKTRKHKMKSYNRKSKKQTKKYNK